MKKSLIVKIIPILILAAVCFIVPTSCGNLSEKDAQKVAETFMNAWVEMDVDTIKKCVDDTEKLPEIVRTFKGMYMSKDEILYELPASFKNYKQEIGKIIDKMIARTTASAKYSITETKDGYVFTVEVTYAVGDKSVSLQNAINETMAQATLEQIIAKLMRSGKISVNSNVNDIMDILMPEVMKLIEQAVEEMKFETKTEKLTLVVYETEYSEILVNAEKSGFEN